MATAERSIEYTFLVLEIFKASDEDLALQLELHSLQYKDPDDIYVGDVTYSEYEFLLLKELEFRLTCYPQTKTGFHTQVAQYLKDNA